MEYRELIHKNVNNIRQLHNIGNIDPFLWLSNSIEHGKIDLKINTVDFIIVKILDRNNRIYKFKTKQSFDVYVIGTFRKFFNPTVRVAEAFSDFYLEMGILPNIISIPKYLFMSNSKYFQSKIRNGVLLYERR